MRFLKIRYANKQVELNWEERDGETKTKHETASAEPPTPAFITGLEQMRKHLPIVTDASEEYLATAEVRSVNISYDKNDRRSVTLSATRPVAASNSPLNLNTPAIIETSEIKEGSLFNDIGKLQALFADVDALAVHAKGFLDGERGEAPEPVRETDPGQTTIEEHINEAVKTQATAAFLAIMGSKPEKQAGANKAVMNRIVHVFDGVTYEDEHGDPGAKRITGLYKHVAGENTYWVRVDATADIPRLWFNAPLENFDAAAAPPTLAGFDMVKILRLAWDMDPSKAPSQKQKTGELAPVGDALATAGV